ncbi:hypothetical protein SAMN05216199_0604 [Pedococcus cremeus]|uniref:Uncharacterized protein n=1 Tax=Pedococcus cremeus TaxID=587636 RepID=A0A1H9XVG4_9MICO|nr:hypothetical protein [Pedococcus cremeus]SES50069.1 hypothetical protein SAMN05216199_0604 [Pedococcus cremeus]
MGILPWSSTRGRPHPRGGHAGLSSGGSVEDAELAHDPELAAGWQAVVAVATAPPRAGELDGLERALSHFRRAVPVSTVDTRDEGRWRMTPTTLGSRIGVAAAGALLLGFGGVGAFALTGSSTEGRTAAVPTVAPTTGPGGVPAPSAQVSGSDESDESGDASDDAGDADGSGTPKSGAAPTTAVGPDAKGPAAHGLCTAWSHAKPSKRTAGHSVAFRNLVTAAGGADKVEAYCASLPRPSAGKPDKPSSHPTGPSSGKAGKGSAHPTGKPSSLPGRPSTLPGKPSSLPGKPSTLPGNGTGPSQPSTGAAPAVTPTTRG